MLACNSRSCLFLFIFLLIFSTGNPYVTAQDAWAIHSPQIGCGISRKKSVPKPYEYLKELGQQANEQWKSADNASAVVQNLTSVFSAVDSFFLIEVIDEILQDDALLEEVMRASYRNVTGFLKIVLVSGGKEAWKLRLHVWEKKELEFPHNHKWDFFSKIMAGYLIQDIYQPIEGNAATKKYIEREPVSLMPIAPDGQLPCPCRDNYILASKNSYDASLFACQVNTIGLEVTQQNLIGVGESYFMPNHLIHTITPGKDAITFVFTSDQVTNNSSVFVPEDTPESRLTKYAPSITKEELVQELHLVKKVLGRLALASNYLPELIDPEHHYYNKKDALFQTPTWRSTFLSLAPITVVTQLTDEEKKQYIVSADADGKALVGDQKAMHGKEYLFVLLDGVMYATLKDFEHTTQNLICHTSFTDYACVDSPGVLHFDAQGDLVIIEAYSGHYAPTLAHMEIALDYLKSQGVATEKTVITGYRDRF